MRRRTHNAIEQWLWCFVAGHDRQAYGGDECCRGLTGGTADDISWRDRERGLHTDQVRKQLALLRPREIDTWIETSCPPLRRAQTDKNTLEVFAERFELDQTVPWPPA